jgi:hypothetical protein
MKRTVKLGWKGDRRGASGVVVTLLVLLVAVGALSMFMSIYVPIWGKDTEAKQMKRIQTQMLSLKENTDMQVLAGKSSTMVTRLTIGDDGGPVFHLTRATGSMRLDPDSGLYIVCNSTDGSDCQGITRGCMEYSSQNTYFVDQRLRYENGALLVIQEGRAVMKAGPHFEVFRDSDGNLSASISLMSLSGAASTRSGTGDIRAEATLNVYDVTSYSGGDWALGKSLSLNMTTPYPSVWADFFNSTLGLARAGLVQGTDYSVSIWPGGVNATLFNVNRLELGLAVVEMQLEM